MWATITKPFAWLLLWFYDLTGNYGISVILFALVVNLILTPFMGKSKKSTMRTTRLKPRIDEIQRRHKGNPQKLNEEMAKLYKEEHINPMSGCLWSLIPFPILIALYSVIRQPLTRMMSLSTEIVTKIQDYFVSTGLYTVPAKRDAYAEIKLAQLVHEHWNELQAALPGQLGKLQDIDFSFLGMNMGNTPQWNFFTKVDWSNTASWLPELGLFLIPIIAAVLSWLSMKVSSLANPPDPQAQAQMKTMNIFMPIMSVWMCFIMPAALGVYWIANSVFGMIRDYLQTKYFQKVLDREDAERIAARREREKELDDKHRETLRKKAQGTTEINTNTSKKKLQSQQKAERDERRAAAARAKRPPLRKAAESAGFAGRKPPLCPRAGL